MTWKSEYHRERNVTIHGPGIAISMWDGAHDNSGIQTLDLFRVNDDTWTAIGASIKTTEDPEKIVADWPLWLGEHPEWEVLIMERQL